MDKTITIPREISINGIWSFVIDNLKNWDKVSGDYKVLIFISIVVLSILALKYSITLVLEVLNVSSDLFKKIKENFFISSDLNYLLIRKQQFQKVIKADLEALAKYERWNDQFFTDLEAEVEAEGGYYQNRIHKYLNKASFGTRRVSSLINAINSGTEQCVLLVGEPGSGKSVSLRHLGLQIAEKGMKSKSIKYKVPLYINLKELSPPSGEELNADYIEKFVISNVRRGEKITADYLKKNWHDYKVEGIWFFLFDSFDEIPEVLHSPNESNIILKYSTAIREFMEGMGECRGILASREYKGPEAIPWQKIRILPLSTKQKESLVTKSLISKENKKMVSVYLATENDGTFDNPLFLSLLCRYVESFNKIPENDHDLMLTYLKNLISDDSDYLFENYSIIPEQLFNGAISISVLFAMNDTINLAPKYDEMIAGFKNSNLSIPDNLENLLAALIDVKIGRCDVKESRKGEQRFTFSHRRYQETLFVYYLSRNNVISIQELLNNSRWREFTVTLLQSQSEEVIEGIIEVAKVQFDKISTLEVKHRVLEKYYDWNEENFLHVLRILNEGLGKRKKIISFKMRESIKRLIEPVIINGDIFDRLMIVKHCVFLPSEEYERMISWGVETDVEIFKKESAQNIHHLSNVPQQIKDWFNWYFATDVLLAESDVQLHKADALRMYLPKEFNLEAIFNRSKNLRAIIVLSNGGIFIRSLGWLLEKIEMVLYPNREKHGSRVDKMILIYLFSFYLEIILLASTFDSLKYQENEVYKIYLLALASFLWGVVCIRLIFIHKPFCLNPLNVLAEIPSALKRLVFVVDKTKLLKLMLLVFFILVGVKISFLLFKDVRIFIGVSIATTLLMISTIFKNHFNKKKFIRKVDVLINEKKSYDEFFTIVKDFNNYELLMLINRAGQEWVSLNLDGRRLLRHLSNDESHWKKAVYSKRIVVSDILKSLI